MNASARTGRPLGFDPHAAIDRAVEVFWEHGYDGASTAKLEAATSLSRSSLLNTFGPKESLFLTVLDRYQESVDAVLVGPMRDGSAGLADIEQFLARLGRLKTTAPGSYGCLIVNTAAELAPAGDDVQQRVDRYRHGLADGITAAVTRAVQRDEIGAAGLAERVEVLVGLAVAVNWTARVGGGRAGQRLARAARAVVSGWRQG